MSKLKDEMYRDRVESDYLDTGESEIQSDEALVLNHMVGGTSESVRNSPKVKIIIHNQDGETGNQPVFVSLNGMGYSIPREIPVLIPLPIVEVLKHCVETKYIREQRDGQQFGPVLERQVNRFSMSISDASF